MQADAAKLFQHLIARGAVLAAAGQPGRTAEEPPEEARLTPVEAPHKAEGPGALTWAFIPSLGGGGGI